jgi:hypothetical protein
MVDNISMYTVKARSQIPNVSFSSIERFLRSDSSKAELVWLYSLDEETSSSYDRKRANWGLLLHKDVQIGTLIKDPMTAEDCAYGLLHGTIGMGARAVNSLKSNIKNICIKQTKNKEKLTLKPKFNFSHSVYS